MKLDLCRHLISDEELRKHVFGASTLSREGADTSYREYILEQAGKVAIIGTVTRGGDGALQLAGTAQVPLVISNQDAALVPATNDPAGR